MVPFYCTKAYLSVSASDFALKIGFNRYVIRLLLPVLMLADAIMPGMIGSGFSSVPR